MRPVRNVFQKLSRTEQRREGVVAYLWSLPCSGYQLIFIHAQESFDLFMLLQYNLMFTCFCLSWVVSYSLYTLRVFCSSSMNKMITGMVLLRTLIKNIQYWERRRLNRREKKQIVKVQYYACKNSYICKGEMVCINISFWSNKLRIRIHHSHKSLVPDSELLKWPFFKIKRKF
jgi:hypothetical protein